MCQDQNIFQREYIIEYKNIKRDLTASFLNILDYMQETSLRHTETTDYKMEWYTTNKKVFLLTNWQAEIYKNPRWNDSVTVKTWVTAFKGVICHRAFEMWSGSEIIAKANTGWVFYDADKRVPIKPSIEIVYGYGQFMPPSLPTSFKLPTYEGFEFVSSCQYTALRSDIDSNGHINNLKYIEWAANYIPDEIYDNLNLSALKTVYRKECTANTKVVIMVYCKKETNEVLCSVKNLENEEITYAEIYTKWI